MPLTASLLKSDLAEVLAAPHDHGTVRMVVCRPAKGERRLLTEGTLDVRVGLVGDCWSSRPTRTAGGLPDPDRQLTVMNARVVERLSSDPLRQALAGDQLYLDLDLSVENLPAGSRLGVGTAVIEVTAPPHTGCATFVRHFGEDVMRFVNGKVGRPLRLRGLNAKVVASGTVRPGDAVRKL
ncbi:MAG: hypothetical protein AVDCRST_MAG34-1993 [uncultured Nocardioidaceae bacterium]|uniref:MOSC domain-containing protein n=1 Tax=uncultured Nocardioidaceae bacterium TaxID=253824 RepID=A0A6J4MB32_9ACTN|nr:MAG: hypothetical protein AVDCRST_MAG34-1993 [uncultured Nocardioidaceae bacterium]